MHPDNTAPLILAARKRRELARAKAVRALRELDHAGTPVTFEAVARAAGVSRSWLYGQPDLRADGRPIPWMYVSATSMRLLRGRSTPAIRAIMLPQLLSALPLPKEPGDREGTSRSHHNLRH